MSPDTNAMLGKLKEVLENDTDVGALVNSVKFGELSDGTTLQDCEIRIVPSPVEPETVYKMGGIIDSIVELHIMIVSKRLLTRASDEIVNDVVSAVKTCVMKNDRLGGLCNGVRRFGVITPIDHELGARIVDIPVYYHYLARVT